MFKALKQFVLYGLLTTAILNILHPIVAVNIAHAEDAKSTQQVQTLPLPGAEAFGNLPAPAKGTASQQVYSFAFSIIQNVRYLLGTVAVALIVFAGIRMVLGQGNEEVYTKQRMNIIYGVIGLALVGFAGDIARIFSVYCEGGKDFAGQACTSGGFLKDPNAIIRSVTLFDQRTQFIVTFIKYLIGSIAIIMIVRNGLRMIAMGSQEDKIALDKKNLFYSALGLILIIISDPIINNVFYKLDKTRYPSVGGATPAINAAQGIKELAGFTNIIVSVVSPIAVLVLVAGGIMYVSSAGNEETQGKAKKMIVTALAGIIIMYGAFGIVSTIIAGNFDSGGNGQVTQSTGSGVPQ